MVEVNKRLIVVDDETSIVEAYIDFLVPKRTNTPKRSSRLVQGPLTSSESEYEILVAHSGEEALLVLRRELQAGRRIAGGFFDVKMDGGMDGLETIQQIWKLDPDVHCTVVTAYHDRNANDIDQLFGPRFKDQWDYLNKPFTQAEIIQKARQMLAAWGRRRALEQTIEQLKASQTRLIQSERQAVIGQIARAVGHEFGNFLQAIVGKADLALHDQDIQEIQTKLKDILRISDRASLVTRNLRSFSKVSPTQSKEDVARIVKDTLTFINYEFRKHSIKVEEKLSPCASVFVNGPEIEQVLLNLLLNALHSMPKGGTIEVGCEESGPSVTLWVKDHGTGIKPEVLPKIFDYAFTTKAENGSGLGLSISKDIMEKHHGKITVETELGKGSKFTLTLPKAK